jgi:tetratricopeptide (TPR) repeat protein
MMHLIYLVNYYFFDISPLGFHLVNLLFHCAVSVLVFLVTRRFLFEYALCCDMFARSLLFPSVVAALLFATHPIHTEAVAWVAGVPDLSYAFFFMLSLYLYLEARRMKWCYYLSVVAFFIATLCKEPAFVFPLVLLACDVTLGAFFPSGPSSDAPAAIRRSPFGGLAARYGPYLLVGAASLALRIHALRGFAPREPRVQFTGVEYALNIILLLAAYLKKLVLPVGLNVFHVLHPVHSVLDPRFLVGLGICLAVASLAVVAVRRYRVIFFCFVLTLLPLLPALYISAVGENTFAERYLYLPSFGFLLATALALSRVVDCAKWPVVGVVCLGALALALSWYSWASWSRNGVWRDEYALFSDSVRESPDSATVHTYLGIAHLEKNEMEEAGRELEMAVKLNPAYALAHYNLGLVRAAQERLDEAAGENLTSLRLKPDLASAH